LERLILVKEGTILWTKGIPLDETIDSSMPDIIVDKVCDINVALLSQDILW
jgi:hypothetical protein